MFCPKCGIQNPDAGKFCRSCGTDLGNVSDALSGNIVIEKGCGTNLRGIAEAIRAVWTEHPSGEKPDGVLRPTARNGRQRAWEFRVPGIHALLGENARWWVDHQAKDTGETAPAVFLSHPSSLLVPTMPRSLSAISTKTENAT